MCENEKKPSQTAVNQNINKKQNIYIYCDKKIIKVQGNT